MAKKRQGEPLEEGLVRALRSLDNQIAREMQRTPEERMEKGIHKWEPYNKRVEYVTSFLLNTLGEDVVGLDSVMVLAQAMCKTLSIVSQDLGTSGLGKVRSMYLEETANSLGRDLRELQASLSGNSYGDLN